MKFFLDCTKWEGTIQMRKMVLCSEKKLLYSVKTLVKQGVDRITIQVDRVPNPNWVAPSKAGPIRKITKTTVDSIK